MKAITFDDLTTTNKFKVLNEFAVHLLSIEHYDHRVHLYSLDSIFIELYLNIETKKVDRIHTAAYSDLDKYLSRIMLGRLSKR